MTRFGVPPGVRRRRTRDMRAGPAVRPGCRGATLGNGDPHQTVVARVELDLVGAVAVPIVGAQLGPEPVGLLSPRLRLLAAGEPAQTANDRPQPGGTLRTAR